VTTRFGSDLETITRKNPVGKLRNFCQAMLQLGIIVIIKPKIGMLDHSFDPLGFDRLLCHPLQSMVGEVDSHFQCDKLLDVIIFSFPATPRDNPPKNTPPPRSLFLGPHPKISKLR